MISRKMIGMLAIVSVAAQLCGCRKSFTTADAVPTGKVPVSPQVAPMETILRVHWIGKRNISADTNSAKLLKIWNLPESGRLETQTLDKISIAPWRLMRGETNRSASNLLRPLLEGLVNEESYVEVRRATNSTNATAAIVLAMRLDNQRA